jgi:hypothetical protein
MSATAAERKRAQRQRARDAGLCVVNPAHGPAGENRVACAACSADAYARVKARRARLSATAQ